MSQSNVFMYKDIKYSTIAVLVWVFVFLFVLLLKSYYFTVAENDFYFAFLSRCFVRLLFGRDAYRLLPMEHVLRIAEVHAA